MKINNFIKRKDYIKTKLVVTLLIIVTIINICNMSFASIVNEPITVIERWRGVIPFQYGEEDRISVNRMANGVPVYAMKKNNEGGINFTPNKIEKCNDVEIINILKNGYGIKTFEELNCTNETQATLATQEALYTKLEGRNLEDYKTFDDEGVHIIKVAQNILENANNEINDITNRIEIVEKDQKWKDYEIDNNFKYKEYEIVANTKELGTIEIQKGKDVKIIDSNTKATKQTFSANDTFCIVLPKNVEQEIKIKLFYEAEQFSVYKFKESEELENTYFLPQIRTEEIATTINENVTGNTKIKIINKDIKSNEPIIGSIFSIVNEKNETIKENLVTDEKGIINTFLDNGKYYLKQIRTIGDYSINKSLIEININNNELVTINVGNDKTKTEESTKIEQEINVKEENKDIIENNIKEVYNITSTNINKEIINETNETNLHNINNFINTINRKNIINLQKENTYRNYIEEQGTVLNKILEGENKTINMTRQDYINYIDMIMLNSAKIPTLPVASK